MQVRKQEKCPCPVGRSGTSKGQGMEVACLGGTLRIPVWLEPSAGRRWPNRRPGAGGLKDDVCVGRVEGNGYLGTGIFWGF